MVAGKADTSHTVPLLLFFFLIIERVCLLTSFILLLEVSLLPCPDFIALQRTDPNLSPWEELPPHPPVDFTALQCTDPNPSPWEELPPHPPVALQRTDPNPSPWEELPPHPPGEVLDSSNVKRINNLPVDVEAVPPTVRVLHVTYIDFVIDIVLAETVLSRERLVKILVGYLNEMQYSMIDNECKAIFNASHEQVEESSNRPWRTEPTYVAKYGDDLWLGVYLSHRMQRPSSKSKDKWLFDLWNIIVWVRPDMGIENLKNLWVALSRWESDSVQLACVPFEPGSNLEKYLVLIWANS
ncbi:hypothetical protein DY000_02033820 [Brassica cretica]|uniref:DUF4283 domain-containing protein n=1 Tax=Brassica cretica TaxID=69181 RepID=A0ABQ7DP99_BRACR|nr:hypothetical protein DY000_02033820 [Brassica cretica]